jgi:hypothetical protein
MRPKYMSIRAKTAMNLVQTDIYHATYILGQYVSQLTNQVFEEFSEADAQLVVYLMDKALECAADGDADLAYNTLDVCKHICDMY